MKFSMENDNDFIQSMKRLKKSMEELKKLADEVGADIETHSLDYKLYMMDDSDSSLFRENVEKRKKLFEEKSKKDNVFK